MMDSFKKIIIDNISKLDKRYDKFISYLNNYWFKKDNSYYNHSLYIKDIYDKENKLDIMYLTNNIEESLHSKISYFLPKKKNRYNFIKCIKIYYLMII